jgi:hypothetical protein
MPSEGPRDSETDTDDANTQEAQPDAETDDAEAEQVALVQSDSRVWVPSFDLLTMVAGIALQNPSMVFTVGLKGPVRLLASQPSRHTW